MMNNVDLILDSAFSDYNQGNYPEAEQKVREALILSPTHGDALYLLGLISYKKGIFVQAIDILNLLVKLYPTYQNYQLTLAEVYQNNGDYDKAKELFLKAKNNPQAFVQVGWIEMKQGNLKKAKSIFEKVLRKNSLAEAWWGMAELVSENKKLAYLKKAYKITPLPGLAEEIALYYLMHKKYRLVKPYLKIIPDNKLIQALWFRSQKEYERSLFLLKELTQENAYLWKNWFFLAETAEMAKDITLAETAYRRVLSLDKKNLDACRCLARLYMEQGRISEALDEYQKLVRENPQDKESLLALAVILQENNEIEEALGIYFNLLTLGQKGLSSTIFNLIQKLAQKDKETAMRFAEGWAKNFPKEKRATRLLEKLKNAVLFFLCALLTFSAQAQIYSADEEWGILWDSKMAAYGVPDSQYKIAQIYEEGKGIPRNLPKAVEYYQMAARQNYLPAAMKLAHLFSTERSILNEKKALEWYNYAANQGEIQAQIYLFHYYDEKNPPDKEKALYWLTNYLKKIYPNETDFSRVSADYERFFKQVKR